VWGAIRPHDEHLQQLRSAYSAAAACSRSGRGDIIIGYQQHRVVTGIECSGAGISLYTGDTYLILTVL